MKRWPAILGVVIGLAVAGSLLALNDVGKIAILVAGAGWGIAAVVGLHVPQIVLSALGWRALLDDPRPPGLLRITQYRWVREAVNALLPVAQIGGDFVRARLAVFRGVTLRAATSCGVVDLSIEMLAQIAFSLMGLLLFFVGPHTPGVMHMLVGATVLAAIIAVSFMVSQRLGLFMLVERLLQRAAEKSGWAALGDLSGLHDEVVALYKHPGRFWSAFLWHLASWLFGTLETWAAMSALHLGTGWREAAIIESLGQAIRGLGFFIPGALGVQEGGYILICGLFGVSPQGALALSLIRRIRELSLGIPGLIVWHRIEHKRVAGRDGQPVPGAEQP